MQVDVFTVTYKRFDSLVSRNGTSLQAPSTFFLMNLVFSRHIVLSFPPQIAKELRETLSLMEDQMEQKLANSLFPVYLSLQAIYKDKAFLQKRSEIITLDDLSYMAALHLSHRSKCTTPFLKQLLENLTINHINCFLIKTVKILSITLCWIQIIPITAF